MCRDRDFGGASLSVPAVLGMLCACGEQEGPDDVTNPVRAPEIARVMPAFHLMSWLMRTGEGDAFVSDTVIVTESGCEFLTEAPRGLTVRYAADR